MILLFKTTLVILANVIENSKDKTNFVSLVKSHLLYVSFAIYLTEISCI